MHKIRSTVAEQLLWTRGRSKSSLQSMVSPDFNNWTIRSWHRENVVSIVQSLCTGWVGVSRIPLKWTAWTWRWSLTTDVASMVTVSCFCWYTMPFTVRLTCESLWFLLIPVKVKAYDSCRFYGNHHPVLRNNMRTWFLSTGCWFGTQGHHVRNITHCRLIELSKQPPKHMHGRHATRVHERKWWFPKSWVMGHLR